MKPYEGRNCTLAAAGVCLAIACAADPGDALKTSTAFSASDASTGSDMDATSSSSSGAASASSGTSSGASSSGSGGSSSSSGGSGSNSGSGSGSGNGGGSNGGSGSVSGNGSGSSGGSGAGSGNGSGSNGGSGANSDSGLGSGSASSSGSASDGGGGVDAARILPEGGAGCITPSCQLHLQSKALQPGASTQAIAPSINISANIAGVDLANVKVRYYYTADGNTAPTFVCDFAGYLNSPMTLSQSSVQGAFVPMGASATPWADTYLELSFPSATLPVGSTVEVNARFFSPNYPMYNQTNDWSFLSSSSTAYVDAPYITAYLNAALAWGIEPGGPTPDAGGAIDAGAPADAAPGDAGDGG